MRTRSVQLVTSWWVVCVWAALSLATGLVSVVAVLQPAWYVRYSQIHAQDAQGVAFQVMVSSVGPLGYCRLAGVSQVTVPGEERRPSHAESSAGVPLTTPATLWISAHPSSTGVSGHPLDTPGEGLSSTQPPTEDTQPTTLSPRVVEGPATPANSGEGKTSNSNEGSTSETLDETTTTTTATTTNPILTSGSRYKGNPTSSSSSSQATTTTTSTSTSTSTSATENSVTAEANRSDELLTTTGSLSVDDPSEADAVKANFMPQEHKTTAGIPGTPREENKPAGVEVVTPKVGMDLRGVGGGGGSVRKDKKNRSRKKLTQPHKTATGGVSEARRNTTTTAAGKGRKKKGKYRRRKKKNRRKRPRDREGGRIMGRSQGRGAPRPQPPLHHLLRSRLDGREDPLASPLLQQPRPRQEKLISEDYQPRPPILYCSGVGGGVGSGSSAVWALVGVLYGVAGVVQVAVGVASLALHLPHAHTHARRYIFAAWLGNVQVAIVMSQGVALVLFPLGLGSPLARGECGGSSSVYWPGACSFGWSYMLGVVATTLAAYCPCLARLTVFRRYNYKEWDSINFF